MKKEFYNIDTYICKYQTVDIVYNNYNIFKRYFYKIESEEDKVKRLNMIREDKIQALINNTEFIWKAEYDEPKPTKYYLSQSYDK
jgi:hypothetical protein